MKRMLIALALVAAMVSLGIGGIHLGQKTSDAYWSPKIEETTQLLRTGTYHMAWTNVRACVLAVDSSVMRFLASPTPERYKELQARYGACEQHWTLLSEYSPDDPKEYSNIDEARFSFDNWANQIAYMLKIQIMLLTTEDESQALELYKTLIREREESRKYRDHIEKELFEAW